MGLLRCVGEDGEPPSAGAAETRELPLEDARPGEVGDVEVKHELHAPGAGREESERDERLEAAVDQPPADADPLDAGVLGIARPVDQSAAGGTGE